MLEVDPVLPQRLSGGDMTLNRTPRALITWLLADKSVSQTSGLDPYPATELPRQHGNRPGDRTNTQVIS